MKNKRSIKSHTEFRGIHDKKSHFRNWKSGKKWLYSTSMLTLLVGGSSNPLPELGVMLAHADETAPNQSTEEAVLPNERQLKEGGVINSEFQSTATEALTQELESSVGKVDTSTDSSIKSETNSNPASSVKSGTLITAASIVSSGTYGTCPWYLSDDGKLHIGAGTLAASGETTSPFVSWGWVSANSVNEIVFDGPVKAGSHAAYFGNLTSLTKITNLNLLDVSNSISLGNMFYNCSSLQSLDLSNFNTSNTANMLSMFQGCGVVSLDVSHFDTRNVTSMNGMFKDMPNMRKIDLSSFNTSKLIDISGMFTNSGFTELDLSSFNFVTPDRLRCYDLFSFNNVHKLVLGSHFEFPANAYNNRVMNIPDYTDFDPAKYTGLWQEVGTGTDAQPNGNIVGTTPADSTVGLYHVPAGTYVWQPKVIPPVAKDDTFETPEDTVVTIPVLANDTGENLEVVSVISPQNGTAEINSDGTLNYTPNPGYVGADTFTYTVKDDAGQTATARVNITVTPSASPAIDGVAQVTYIEVGTDVPLSVDQLKGEAGSTSVYRTADKIKEYEAKGYVLVSNDYPENGVVFDEDDTSSQDFTVYLKHGTVSVNQETSQEPGTPINPEDPDGPKWPQGTDKASLTKDINRTINYLDKQIKAEVATKVDQKVTYDRTAIVDKVTGDLLGYDTDGDGTVDTTTANDAWTSSNNKWAEVTSPDLASKGYKAPDKAKVDEATVAWDDSDATVDVYYDHGTVPVGPETPQEPGIPINPEDPDGPKWPEGTDKASLQKEINQTIHYIYKDGKTAAPDKTDKVVFNHEIVVDKVTGKIIQDSGWKAANEDTTFDAKISPALSGYTPDAKASKEITGLTKDSKDDMQTIVYTAEPVPAKDTPKGQTPASSASSTTSVKVSAASKASSKASKALPDTGESQRQSLMISALGLGLVAVLGVAVALKRRRSPKE